jgi:S-adenosylmethionine decarboxylase
MAYDDTLFQLGMDLTRSSTAQKEDIGEVACRTSGTFDGGGREADAVRSRVRSTGHHQSIDLYGARHLGDAAHIERMLRRCLSAAGGKPLGVYLHQLEPSSGVAGVAILADCHVSVRSWPERGYLALDVVNSGDAGLTLSVEQLKRAFAASSASVATQRRGTSAEPAKAASGRSKVSAIGDAKSARAKTRRAA